jgi:hypothetical protein
MAGRRPPSPAVAPSLVRLHLCLFRHLQRVVPLDCEVPHGALEPGVTEQELNGSEILSPAIDRRRLGPAYRMRASAASRQSSISVRRFQARAGSVPQAGVEHVDKLGPVGIACQGFTQER